MANDFAKKALARQQKAEPNVKNIVLELYLSADKVRQYVMNLPDEPCCHPVGRRSFLRLIINALEFLFLRMSFVKEANIPQGGLEKSNWSGLALYVGWRMPYPARRYSTIRRIAPSRFLNGGLVFHFLETWAVNSTDFPRYFLCCIF